MFRPQPLLVLPREAERWQGAHKRRTSSVSFSTITWAPLQSGALAERTQRRTSNVSPSTITSAALHGGAATSTCSPLFITSTMAPAGPPNLTYLLKVGRI